MIGKLNHVAIVVPDLQAAAVLAEIRWERRCPSPNLLRLMASPLSLSTSTTRVSNCCHPLGEDSPIRAFLERHPDGGIHHVCYEVDDILDARDQLKARGAQVLGDGPPRIGAHGKPVLFLHPKDFCGTLVELERQV